MYYIHSLAPYSTYSPTETCCLLYTLDGHADLEVVVATVGLSRGTLLSSADEMTSGLLGVGSAPPDSPVPVLVAFLPICGEYLGVGLRGCDGLWEARGACTPAMQEPYVYTYM